RWNSSHNPSGTNRSTSSLAIQAVSRKITPNEMACKRYGRGGSLLCQWCMPAAKEKWGPNGRMVSNRA
ncbi:hypothetical protein ACFYZ5_44940, partial [Streptomyces chartreusis]